MGNAYLLAQHGLKKNTAKALNLFERGCKVCKDPDACFDLGMSYIEGYGVRKNLKRGVDYLGEACKLDTNVSLKERACELFHYYRDIY